MPEQILLDQILYNTFLVVSMTMLFCAGAQILCVLEGYKIKPFEQRPWFQRLAKSSQSNQPKKGKGIILREAVSFLAGVYLLLLDPAVSYCEVCFTWIANTDGITTGYNIYTRQFGIQEWVNPHVIPGVDTTLACVDLPPGSYEATITGWGHGETYVDPVASGESGYFTPFVPFTVYPETCMEVQGFRVME